MLRASLLTLLVIFAAIFGSVVASESNHADQPVATMQVGELVHDGDHRHDPGKGDERGDTPCQTGLHHHCNLAISGVGDGLAPAALGTRETNAPFKAKALASLSTAPPLEPPAA